MSASEVESLYASEVESLYASEVESLYASEVESLSAVEVDECSLVYIFVFCLCQVALGLEEVVFLFVKLGDGGFAVFVFAPCQFEGIGVAVHRLSAAAVLADRGHGVVLHLLNLLVEVFLCVFESQRLVFLVYLRRANLVACREVVEDRY